MNGASGAPLDPPRQSQHSARSDADPSSLPHEQDWQLRLYVAGQMTCSLAALANLFQLCSQHLRGRHYIEVVDVFEDHTRAETDGIVAVPTLVCRSATPPQKIVGTLSQTDRVLTQLTAGFYLSAH